MRYGFREGSGGGLPWLSAISERMISPEVGAALKPRIRGAGTEDASHGRQRYQDSGIGGFQ